MGSMRRPARGTNMRTFFKGLALAGMLLAAAAEAPARAGACSGFGANCGCGPAVEVVAPCQPMVESYLVNQGSVFSGPGHYLHQLGDPDPCCYPSVGFVYSGYPYGAYGPGGYPRGFYSPYAGYPYADAVPYFAPAYHGAIYGYRGRMVRSYYHRRAR
jgi:hypothetical protein